jgi:hypothetical protein
MVDIDGFHSARDVNLEDEEDYDTDGNNSDDNSDSEAFLSARAENSDWYNEVSVDCELKYPKVTVHIVHILVCTGTHICSPCQYHSSTSSSFVPICLAEGVACDLCTFLWFMCPINRHPETLCSCYLFLIDEMPHSPQIRRRGSSSADSPMTTARSDQLYWTPRDFQEGQEIPEYEARNTFKPNLMPKEFEKIFSKTRNGRYKEVEAILDKGVLSL